MNKPSVPLPEMPDDLISRVLTFLYPHIEKAVQKALAAYDLDRENNDNNILGTYVARNLVNRIKKLGNLKNLTVRQVKPNDYQVILRHNDVNYPFRVHRVNERTRVPRGARALKRDTQLLLPLPFFQKQFQLGMKTLFVGYIMDHVLGLTEVFLGCLLPTAIKTKPECAVLATLYSAVPPIDLQPSPGVKEIPSMEPLVTREVVAGKKRLLKKNNRK